MIKKILRSILKINVGLEPLPHDDRDLGFSFSNLFGVDYTPKHKLLVLPLPFPASTQRNNTCGWHSSTRSRELDEGVELDPRVTVMFASELGLFSGDGFSNLRNNEVVMKDRGAAEIGKLRAPDNGTFSDYSNHKYLTKEVRDNAANHRTKSFSAIHYTSQVYKALDDGRVVKIGVDWRTAFNMGGGFANPWILNFIKGWLVGGHATYVRGYNLAYRSKKVFRVRNSYGPGYGDNGDFYITEADMQKQIDKYGAFINLDMDKDVLAWLRDHQGWVVKTKTNPSVYLIQGDKKRKYDDMATIYAHGKTDADINTVDVAYLDKVAEGKNIDFWSGGNIKAIKSLIQQKKNLKPIFEKYFSELLN